MFLPWPSWTNITVQILFQQTKSDSEDSVRSDSLDPLLLGQSWCLEFAFFFCWPAYMYKLFFCKLINTHFPPKSWEFMKLWQWTMHARTMIWLHFWGVNIVKCPSGFDRDLFLFCVPLGCQFHLTHVTSNALFFAFCIITVHDGVLWYESAQNGHGWYPEACYFVSLSEKEEVVIL